MEIVNELLGRDRRGDSAALVTPSGRERSYHELLTNAWKAANVLRYLGVHQGATVAVTPQKTLHPLLAFLGAAQLGAVTRFTSPRALPDRPRAGVITVDELRDVEIDSATKLTCHGGAPESPEIVHWEEELWSENPAQAPATHGSDTAVIGGESAVYTHRDILDTVGESPLNMTLGQLRLWSFTDHWLTLGSWLEESWRRYSVAERSCFRLLIPRRSLPPAMSW